MNSLEQVGEWIFRRRTAVVVGACALTVTMVSVGGAWALMSAPRPSSEVTAESGARVPVSGVVPAIMTEDTSAAHHPAPGSVDRLLDESRSRSAQAVAAGETVYAAARRSASSGALEGLRGALDETTAVLATELPGDASDAARTEHLETLEARRAALLDAASLITQVRRVPAEELPEGATTVAVAPQDPSPTMPTADPTGEPVTAPTPVPSGEPATTPVPEPSTEPSAGPTAPGATPAPEPSVGATAPTPSPEPSGAPSSSPVEPTQEPGDDATGSPEPSAGPSSGATSERSGAGSGAPTPTPSGSPAG
ncbi:hypothetical protein [Myceligenerans crystallogenes]|uniref:Meckel syndrome type 1 protein n=1 Tax=Myceligenerans crystallogenes TaxID=316335 RepID=A0ABN2NGY6_9MICO